MSLEGIISNISRGSLHDGPGVRTVVYFKGCGLRCKWCHNPETFSLQPSILYFPQKCISCKNCIRICPQAHKEGEGHMVFLRESCKVCGDCAQCCPTGALTRCGDMMSTGTLLTEVMKDYHYYQQSGGGVTISGGECLLQVNFAEAFLRMCQKKKIHTAIESSFHVPLENALRILPVTDLVFADLKHPDPDLHQYYTGFTNEQIIQNIREVSRYHSNIIIRIPVIPGVNDAEKTMKAFGRIITSFHGGVKGVELMKYNYLAKSKYESLGLNYNSFGEQTQSKEQMGVLVEILQSQITQPVFYDK